MTTPTPDSSGRLRMAVVGCGPIGVLHAQAIRQSPAAQLVAVCEMDAARRDQVGRQFDVPAYETLERLLAAVRPGAVTVATPDHLHLRPVLQAVESGCPVFCEKPLATSLDDALQMVAAAAEQRVQLGVDYNRRFAAGYRAAHDMLQSQAIGDLEYALIRVTDRTPPPKVAREPYVMLGTLLTHHLDLVRWYGGSIRRLHAHAAEISRGLLRRVSLSLELDSGAHATIVSAYRDDQPRTAEWMTLHGTRGSIVVEELARRVILSTHEPDHCAATEFNRPFEQALADSIVAHVGAFIASIVVGQQPPVTGYDGLAGLELARAAVESISSGKTIEVSS